jgi:SAM-dependent methyltransferase
MDAAGRERAVAVYYDRLAPVYGDGVYFAARRAAVLAAVAAEVARARALLDLGCGNGAYAAEFATRAPAASVTGADLSPEMLRAARGRAGGRVALVRADAGALPFRAASFDLVFMSHVLLLVADVERCVTEVARSLVPGGVLVATVGSHGWRDVLPQFLGAADLQALEGLFAASRLRAAENDESQAAAACVRAGLRPEWRRTSFAVGWPAVEEWIRIRWLTIADAEQRARVERWFAATRPCAGALTLPLAETLLLARKPRSE